METATGKIVNKPYGADKYDQLFVVWTEDNSVWLMKQSNGETKIALYDLKTNQFKFDFGELEKLNSNLDWKSTYFFYLNTTEQNGLLVEANDRRFYRIDPYSGNAEIVLGKFEKVDYKVAKNFHLAKYTTFNSEFRVSNINGNRSSITGNNGNPVSEDDFIEVKFLTLTKNKKPNNYSEGPITYYKNNFFVLSPVTSDSEKDLELAMLDKTTLKTIWKIQLPQKELKTFIPNYGMERFFIKDDQLFVSNNDYLITINLATGKIIKKEGLYD